MKIMLVKDRNVLNTKFLAQFANSLDSIGHEVHIVSDSVYKEGSGVTLNDGVKYTNLSKKTKSSIKNILLYLKQNLSITSFRYAKFIKKEKPDVVICYFMKDIYNVMFLQKYNIPIIMMHHKYPPTIIDRINKMGKIKRNIYKKLFNRVDAHQVLLKSYEKYLTDEFEIKKITNIANEIVPISDDKQSKLNNKKIIYIGRLSKPGKRQHYVIEAFAKIAKDFPDWTVEFWGLSKYPEYDQELKDMISNYGLEKQIFLKGYHPNINEVYQETDIHAFPSAHEGFSLGLGDGMAHGIPAVGFKDTPSVNEMIIDGRNGYLVKDLQEFSDKLKILMENDDLRKEMGKNARIDMSEHTPENIIKKWNEFIKEVVGTYGK